MMNMVVTRISDDAVSPRDASGWRTPPTDRLTRMTALTLKLSRALSRGRATPLAPPSRANLLATLLRKRAAAHNVGSEELEALLRDQIRWALPMEQVVERDE